MQDNEEVIEREYQRLKETTKSNRSSVDSLMAEKPNKFDEKN